MRRSYRVLEKCNGAHVIGRCKLELLLYTCSYCSTLVTKLGVCIRNDTEASLKRPGRKMNDPIFLSS